MATIAQAHPKAIKRTTEGRHLVTVRMAGELFILSEVVFIAVILGGR